MTIMCRTCGYEFPRTLRGEKLTQAIEEHEQKVHESTNRNMVGVGRRRS